MKTTMSRWRKHYKTRYFKVSKHILDGNLDKHQPMTEPHLSCFFFLNCFPAQDENDVYILTKVSDILHSVFSSYKEKVLPWFEQLLQLIVQLIVSVRSEKYTGAV